MQKSVSIIGCGWLGLPLAGHLLSWHYRVFGSTTSKDKLPQLRKWGIRPFLFELDKPEKWNDKLFSSEILVINIPPSKTSNYLENLGKLLERISDKKILFVSSTSVYGPSAFPITEIGKTIEANESVLVAAEEMLRSKCKSLTVIRPAGLIGPGRHPGRFLAGKKNLAGAKIPVNYVSLEDLVSICAELISQERWGLTFNVANPQHPGKEDFYTMAAYDNGMEPPSFDQERAMDGFKLIDGNAVVQSLQLAYQEISWDKYIKSLRK